MNARTRDLALLASGVALGAMVSAIVRLRPATPGERSGVAESGDDSVPSPAPVEGGGAWTRLGDGLLDEWTEWMDRRTPLAVDMALVRTRIEETADGAEVQTGLLAPGIVEVVGSLSQVSQVRVLLDAVAAVPGVRTVVNRLWVEGDIR